jgi:hypothetical protein
MVQEGELEEESFETCFLMKMLDYLYPQLDYKFVR